MRRIKPLKKVLLGISSFFLIFLAGTQKANAFVGAAILVGTGLLATLGLFTGVAEKLIDYISNAIVSVILFIGEVFLRVSAWLMEMGLKLNATLSDSPIIKEGYDVLLSVANIALVIAIIAVAFMVMLRRTGASQLLIRFIAVALIINFGFYIMLNLIIEPVDALTAQIFSAINLHEEGGFYSTFGQSLLNENIVPNELLDSAIEGGTVVQQEDAGSLVLSVALAIAKVSFVGVAMFILITVMFAYAFMFLARYVALSFFIILFPLAIVFWMFPNLKMAGGNLWNQWFQGFSRWLLFGPIGLFFVWLAVKMVTGSTVVQVEDGEFQTFFATVGNMVVVVGFLVGGLIVANKMSVTGASYAQGVAKKAGKGIQNYAKGRAKYYGGRAAYYGGRAATRPLRGEMGRRGAEKLQTLGEGSRLGRFAARATGARALGGAMSRARVAGEKQYTDAKKEISKLSLNEQRKRLASAPAPERLAIISNLQSEQDKASKALIAAERKERKVREEGTDEEVRVASAEAQKARERHEEVRQMVITIPETLGGDSVRSKLKTLFGQNELRMGRGSEELAEALRQEGRDEAVGGQPQPAPVGQQQDGGEQNTQQ